MVLPALSRSCFRMTVPALTVVLFVAGCACFGVGHLHPEPLVLNMNRAVQMRFWRIEYTAEPMRSGIGIRCRAFLSGEPIPADVGWIETLNFSVYLSDSTGSVVWQGQADLPPRPLDRNDVCGIPFDVKAEPESVSCGPLQISFGYRTALIRDRLDVSEDGVFFVEEEAVRQ